MYVSVECVREKTRNRGASGSLAKNNPQTTQTPSNYGTENKGNDEDDTTNNVPVVGVAFLLQCVFMPVTRGFAKKASPKTLVKIMTTKRGGR
jgi:hypothetical protein